MSRGWHASLIAAMLAVGVLGGARPAVGQQPGARAAANVHFAATTGQYSLSFQARSGAITVRPTGKTAGLTIRELGGIKAANLLSAASVLRHHGSTYTLTGRSAWAAFSLQVTVVAAAPGLIRLRLFLTPARDAPLGAGGSPDVRLLGTPASSLTEYVAAAPVAGNAVYLGDKAMGSTILYYSDYTALGPYFQRTKSGPSQPNFISPGTEAEGSLVGAVSNTFGYEPPPGSLSNLPHHRTTVAVDSYLYLVPGLPDGETQEAETYLRLLATIFGRLPKPHIPAANWPALADTTAKNLSDPANLVSLNGHQYLRSYVSDTRVAPELITQAGVLAGIEAYEGHAHTTVPLAATLDANLPTFYDATFHTVTNHVGHDPQAQDESWYYIDNLISLLQLAQLGDTTARQLLLESADAVIALAHANNYGFPVNFRYGVWAAPNTPLQPDAAGGYAWLMLGLYDLTGNGQYLAEAKASLAHVAGKGFQLSYELHMTAYTAAAAQRLYRLTGDASYHGYAVLALANFFHAARLWDCTYGLCRRGGGYHTYLGIDPLPTGDYIAMLEQYESWLGLRDYARYDQGESGYITDLVQSFLTSTPDTMQYTLPPRLPAGAAASSPGLYDFVKHNNLSWDIPLEDLREGELTSGTIGQEIYGAGGPFMFAAYAP